MESILNEIISSTVAKFANVLAQRMNIPENEVRNIWDEVVAGVTVTTSFKSTTTQEEAAPRVVTRSESKAKAKTVEAATCCYKAKKGKNAGVECGKTVMSGKMVCSSHKKYENDYVKDDAPASDSGDSSDKEVEDAKPAEAAKPVKKTCPFILTKGANQGNACGSNVKDGDFCSKHAKSADKPKKKEPIVPKAKVHQKQESSLVLVKRDIGGKPRHIHLQTGLVVKEGTENATPIVINGVKRNDTIEALNDDDIENCKKYGFSYEEVETIPDFSKKDLESILEELVDDADDEVVDEDQQQEEEMEGEELLEED